jgi:hypothetical protein
VHPWHLEAAHQEVIAVREDDLLGNISSLSGQTNMQGSDELSCWGVAEGTIPPMASSAFQFFYHTESIAHRTL